MEFDSADSLRQYLEARRRELTRSADDALKRLRDERAQHGIGDQTEFRDIAFEIEILEIELLQIEEPDTGFTFLYPDVLVDIAVGIASTVSYEGAKALAKKYRANRTQSALIEYSETELAERAQRALAYKLSIPFSDLSLQSISIPSSSTGARARFRTSGNHFYSIDIKILNGITEITSFGHELP